MTNQIRATSLTFKMAPWPEQGNEPKAPDKSCPKGVESNPSDSSKVDSGIQEDPEARSVLGKTDDKQSEKNTGVSELDDGQLKALLDEAITYKRPKDREGKSHLFRELLEEVEAESDGGEEANPPPFGVVDQCRSSKRHRRDAAVSERQTRGGSLQNIVQAYSDFEIAYSGSRGRKSLGGGGSRRRDLGHYGPGLSGGGGRSGGGSGGNGGGGPGGSSGGSSVSARQREGGSLPCNVNAGSGGGSGGVGPLHGNPGECPFEDVVNRRRSEQTVVVSWDKSDEDVMPAQMDRGGGGGTAVAAPPPGADGVAVGKSSEAGVVERVSEGGGIVVGAPSAKEPPPECVEATTPAAARVADGGGVVFANGVSSLSDGPQQQGAGGQERDGVELRAQRCASLLSAAVEDRTADGVELQLIPENRSGRGKFKDEVCRAEPSPCTSEVLEYVSEQSPVTSPTSLVAAAPSAGNHKTLREMVLGDSVDTVVPFPLHSEEKKPALASASSSLNLDLSKGLVNGTETKPLQLLSTYPSVNSVVGPTSQVSSISEPLPSASLSTSHSGCAENQTIQSGVLEERSVLSVASKDGGVRKQSGESGGPKSMMPIHQGTYPLPTHHLSVLTYPPNHWFSASDTVSRLNFHGGKDLNDIKSKSLDENGNAVTVPQGLNRDAHEKGKGKLRRLKFQDEGYMSQSVEGYCGDQDLDRVLKFIGMDEDKKSKNSCSGPVDRVRRNNIRRESDRSVGSEFTRVRSARDRNYMEEDIATASSDKTSSGPKVGPRSAGGGRQNEIQRGNMMKKSNSLEEISRTKSEDLTIPAASYSLPSKEVVVPQTVERVDGKEGSCESGAKDEDICNHNEKVVRDDNNGNVEIVNKSQVPSAPPKVPIAVTSFKEDFYAVTDASPQVLEETEFHVVTKKQRRKKRKGGANGDGGGSGLDGRGGTQNTHGGYSCGGSVNSHGDRSDDFSRGCDHMEEGNKDNKAAMWGSGGGSDGRFCSYRRHHRRHRGQRSGDCLKSTFSVPPSEHSGESSDDTGSVHSLPVSSSVPRPSADRCSTSSGSTPQASYADIARMPFSTMPVVAGNAGCVPVGNLTAPAPTQKPKTPTTAAPSGQISNFPPMTSANTLSTPSVPHFASAKIGTPPVSGYKTVIVVPTPVSTVDPSSSAVSCTPPNPKPVPPAIPSEEPENVSEAEVSIQISVSVSLEPRKKDAMTCTTLDCKTVVNNYTASTVFSTQPKIEAVEAAAHGVSTSTPNILEDYYPSLQESIQEKTERRNGKLGQQSASMSKVSPVEEKRSSKTTTLSSSVTFTRDNKVPEAEIPVSRVGLVGDKAAVVPVLGKPPPVPVSRKTKEPSVTPTRIKGSGRKPGFRSLPPVVIMDHHYRQDSASKEGSTIGDCNDVAGSSSRNCTSSDIGGFTFGFEVNEELLALSAVDTVESHDPPSSCRTEGEDKRSNGSPSLAVEEESPQSLPAKPVISPVAQCVPSGNELPVFRSPGDVDTKKFNFEKIVSFIGSSWADVMKEVSVPAAKPSSNRVQYYDGTQ
ncbi:uncharacterized protein [Hetaerina americana]|uniref:uncharacterized protein n=1 Tax=Hetaerina americana TaxID=62018 RepID=UPI003A7F1D07